MTESTHYSSGEEDALLHLGLEKSANVAAAAARGLGGLAWRGLSGAARGLGGSFNSVVRSGVRAARPLTQAAESGLTRGVTKVFGDRAGAITGRLTRGMGSRMVSEAIGQGIIGGALEGGIAAWGAEDNKGRAFLRGFAGGFLPNAGLGAVTGGLSHLATRGARMGLRNLAQSRNLGADAALKSGLGAMNRGVFGNVRDLAMGNSAAHGLGRMGSAIALGGNLASHAANMSPMLLPLVAGGGGGTPPPAPPNPYQNQFNNQQNQFLTRTGSKKETSEKAKKSLYIGTYPLSMMAGTALGKSTSEIAIDLLEREGHLPQGTLKKILVSRLGAIPGSLAGALAGHYVGTKLTEDSA